MRDVSREATPTLNQTTGNEAAKNFDSTAAWFSGDAIVDPDWLNVLLNPLQARWKE
jgi:hypothetical protein